MSSDGARGRTRVAVIGLGPIGLELARALVAGNVPEVELVAVADVSPSLVGRELAKLVPGAPPQMRVLGSLAEVLAHKVDAAALCTRSQLPFVLPDVVALARAGVHVISSAEDLAAPAPSPELVALERIALEKQVTVLATGVNPGFVMDRFPLQLAAMCVSVRGVNVSRKVDASQRREPLRRKIGHGLSVAEFEAGVHAGTVGHVGLTSSAALIARGLGTSLAMATEQIEPVTGPTARVLGVRQRLQAHTADGRPISLHLEMWVGAPDPHDRVILDADPPVDARIQGGLHGDRATIGALLDGLRRVGRMPVGLVTVADVY